MTALESASWEVVLAAEAGDLDRLAAALEARQEAMQRTCLNAADPAGRQRSDSTSHPAPDADAPQQATEASRETCQAEPREAGETITPEVFALGEQAVAQLREITKGIRHQQARLEKIQSGFALNASLKPRLDFRG